MKALRTTAVHKVGFVKSKLIAVPIGTPSQNGWTITLQLVQEIGAGVEKTYVPFQMARKMSKELTYQQIADLESNITLPKNTICLHQKVEYLNAIGTLMIIDQENTFDGMLTGADFEIIDSPIIF